MKSIELAYFSGTGNTEIAASMFARKFQAMGYEVRSSRIGKDSGASFVPEDSSVLAAEMLGVGAPVIGIGTPSIVLRYLRKLPAGHGKKAFVFRTSGGVAPVNHNASRDMIAILKRKGYDVVHERLFSIGSNWVIRFSAATMRKLHDATDAKIGAMCSDVIAGIRHTYDTGTRKRATDAILRFVSRIGLRFLSADFRVTGDCTACGSCAKRCPQANVRMVRGQPKFGAKCASCMRCAYGCPKKAIALHRFGFLQLRGGYDVKDILEHPERWPDEGTRENPPFLAGYLADSGRD